MLCTYIIICHIIGRCKVRRAQNYVIFSDPCLNNINQSKTKTIENTHAVATIIVHATKLYTIIIVTKMQGAVTKVPKCTKGFMRAWIVLDLTEQVRIIAKVQHLV